MNNAETLLALGFVRYPEWDWTNTEHYRLQRGAAVYRAYVVDTNPPGVYVRLGLVGGAQGRAHWRDCISAGSVARKLAEAERTGVWPTELGRVVSLPTTAQATPCRACNGEGVSTCRIGKHVATCHTCKGTKVEPPAIQNTAPIGLALAQEGGRHE